MVPLGGMLVRKSVFAGGSGSIYVMGYLDANYRPNMTRDECFNLAKNGNFRVIRCLDGVMQPVR